MGRPISPMLAVSNANAAINFYQEVFGAEVLWHLDSGVAGLAIDGAEFILTHE